MLNTLRTRYADWRRERRIRALRMAVYRASDDKKRMWAIARELFAECDQRSPGQIARMEKTALDRLDPHARAIVERSKGAIRG